MSAPLQVPETRSSAGTAVNVRDMASFEPHGRLQEVSSCEMSEGFLQGDFVVHVA